MKKEILRAIKHHQHIRIIYVGRDGQTTMRVISPLAIEGERLKAYCLTRNGPRVFFLSNLLAIEPVVNDHAV
ncbi:WYL domain-containing protein [Brevibacillus reuszeri]|uniref:WYL domain-containing protein n=1 Tax=Brevibacillus reuszeri TaxID=54915 RepID=UPI003D1B8B9A